MQLSIKQIIALSNGGRVLNDAIGRTFRDRHAQLDDQAYSITQHDANAIAQELDAGYESVPPIGSIDLFGETLTSDAWHTKRSEINNAMVAAKNLFRILGLDIPAWWID